MELNPSIQQTQFVSTEIFRFCRDLKKNDYSGISLKEVLNAFQPDDVNSGLARMQGKLYHEGNEQLYRYFFEAFASPRNDKIPMDRTKELIRKLLHRAFAKEEAKHIDAIFDDIQNKHYYVSFKAQGKDNEIHYLGVAMFDITSSGAFISYLTVSNKKNSLTKFCGSTETFRKCHIGSLLVSLVQCLTFAISPGSLVVAAASAEENFEFWSKQNFVQASFETWAMPLSDLIKKYHYGPAEPKIVPVLLREKTKRYCLLADIKVIEPSSLSDSDTNVNATRTQTNNSMLSELQIDGALSFLMKWTRVRYCKKKRGYKSIMFTDTKPYRGYKGDSGIGTDTFPLRTEFVEEVFKGSQIRHFSPNTWIELPEDIKKRVQTEAKLLQNKRQVQKYSDICDKEWAYLSYCKVEENEKNVFFWSLASTGYKEYVNYVPQLWFFYWEQDLIDQNEKQVYYEIRAKCKAKLNEWVEIPVGHFREKPKECCCKKESPVIFYRQSEGENTCVFASLANALRYIQDFDAALTVTAAMKDSVKQVNRLAAVQRSLRNTMHKYSPTIVSKKRKLNGACFNVFTDISSFPTVCVLEGDDGAKTHAVTLVDSWVFDSNFCHAQPLSQETLDLCCSSIEKDVKFVKVVNAVRFVTDKPLPSRREDNVNNI